MTSLYLDYAASSPLSKEVAAYMADIMINDYGNPSALHSLGISAENKIKEAREYFSNVLLVDPSEIYFSSGGTESNNIAIFGMTRPYKEGGHIITTSIEHSSVIEAYKQLEREGFEVDYLDVDQEGYVDVGDLEKKLREDTRLVSIIAVNNEIGTVQNLNRLCKIIKTYKNDIRIHIDGVQQLGKLPISQLKALDIDSYSASAHKICGPKGVGLLYLKNNIKFMPTFFGGGQQKGIRPGTENLAGIMGFYKALEIANREIGLKRDKILGIKKYFLEKLEASNINYKIMGPKTLDINKASPYIININFEDVVAGILLEALNTDKIYVSTASACQANKLGISHVIKAIDEHSKNASIRFSFYNEIEKKDIDFLVESLKKHIGILKKFKKR